MEDLYIVVKRQKGGYESRTGWLPKNKATKEAKEFISDDKLASVSYIMKIDQTFIPSKSTSEEPTKTYELEAYCRNCKNVVRLNLEYGEDADVPLKEYKCLICGCCGLAR